MTKSKFFRPELDSLRFIAFILILIHHNTFMHIYFIDQIKNIGWLGVDIFFCLSAFLLTRLLMLEQEEFGSINIMNFFIRRILRIWPLYFIYVIIAIVFSWHTHVITIHNWVRVVGLLTFSDNIFAAFNGYNPIRFTGHLWTISYEEQFYLLLPFVIRYFTKSNVIKAPWFLAICFFIGFFIRLSFIYFKAGHPTIWVLPVTHFESVLIGMLFGYCYPTLDKINPIIFFLCAVVSISIILLLPGTGSITYHLMILYPCIGMASGSIVSFILFSRSQIVKIFFKYRPLAFLGRISFGLYVFHNFCISMIFYFLKESQTTLLTFLLSLFLTIALATLSYVLLESPFLKMKRQFTAIPSRPI